MIGRRSYLAISWPSNEVPCCQGVPDVNNNEIEFDRIRSTTAHNLSSPITSSNYNAAILAHPIAMRSTKMQNFSISIPERLNPNLLVHSPNPTQHHRVAYFSIEFQVRPLSERGLLLYFGAFDDHIDQGLGFVSVSLQGGVVEFRVSGTSNRVTVVRSVRTLAIGEWHKIKVTQSGRRLILWVEGNAASSTAPSSEVLINKNDLIYVGGLPDLSRLPYNAISGFPVPFRGCIRKLIVSGVSVALNETNIRGESVC